MLYTLFLVLAVIGSAAFIYFVEYVGSGKVFWWSIPLVFIAAYLAVAITFVAISCLIAAVLPKDKKKPGKPSKFQKTITYQASNYVLKLARVVPVIKHAERIECDYFMLVSNHQSLIDPLAILWAFRDKDITFVMKKEIMDIPLIGGWLRRSGFLPIDRSNNRKAVETIKLGVKKIEEGYNSIGVFPEGTRSHGPNLGAFKHGAFKIAEWSKCPIVVVSIDNAYKIKYHSPFKKHKILIEVLRVIPYEEYKDKNTTELSDLCQKIIQEGIEKRRGQYEWLKAESAEELEQETIVGSFKKTVRTDKQNKK